MEIKNKINEKCKCYPTDSNLGFLAQTSVLIYKSSVSKISKSNVIYLDKKNQYLGIYIRYISLEIHTFRKVRIT